MLGHSVSLRRYSRLRRVPAIIWSPTIVTTTTAASTRAANLTLNRRGELITHTEA